MEFVGHVIELIAYVMIVFTGFGFLWESFIEKSYYPADLVISKTITKPLGIIISLAGVTALGFRLIAGF